MVDDAETTILQLEAERLIDVLHLIVMRMRLAIRGDEAVVTFFASFSSLSGVRYPSS